jgi:hypothetical protein
MTENFYTSNKEKKRLVNIAEQAQFLKEKKEAPFVKAWEEAQIKAATMQSVLNYAVEQFTEHKDELEIDIVEKTTALIEERQTEIKEFLMTEKERYLASIGIQED